MLIFESNNIDDENDLDMELLDMANVLIMDMPPSIFGFYIDITFQFTLARAIYLV